MPISLSVGIAFAQSFKGDYEGSDTGCDITITTGCVDLVENEDPRTSFNQVGFNLGLGFIPVPELGIDIGYANMTGQIGPDGTRRDLFYNPYAEFNGTLTFNVDALYERVIGPERKLAERKGKRRAF